MSGVRVSWEGAKRVAVGLAVIIAACGCASKPIVPSDPGASPEALAALLTRVEKLEAADQRFSQSSEALRQELSTLTAGQAASSATIARLKRELAAYRKDVRRFEDRAYALIQEIQSMLHGRTTALQEDVVRLAAQVQALEADVAELKKTPKGGNHDAAIAKALDSIATSLGQRKSFWAGFTPTLLGTLLGGLIALASSWWLARQKSEQEDAQERLDLTIKITDQYLSPQLLSSFALAKGIVAAAASRVTPALDLNQALSMVGFFKYMLALKSQNRLNEPLLASSRLPEIAQSFFQSILAIPQQHTEWDQVRRAVLS